MRRGGSVENAGEAHVGGGVRQEAAEPEATTDTAAAETAAETAVSAHPGGTQEARSEATTTSNDIRATQRAHRCAIRGSHRVDSGGRRRRA